MKTWIEDSWESYRKKVLPRNAGPLQLKEARQAFFAGATSMLIALDAIAEPGVSEEQGMKVLDSLHVEIAAFVGLPARGK